jgi:hypothetical protein
LFFPLRLGLPVRPIAWVRQADQLGPDIKYQPSRFGRVEGPEYGHIAYEHESHQRSLQRLSRHAKAGPFCTSPFENVSRSHR